MDLGWEMNPGVVVFLLTWSSKSRCVAGVDHFGSEFDMARGMKISHRGIGQIGFRPRRHHHRRWETRKKYPHRTLSACFVERKLHLRLK